VKYFPGGSFVARSNGCLWKPVSGGCHLSGANVLKLCVFINDFAEKNKLDNILA
jgi:hypothetical protein